jgi:hypothetical protein
MCIVNFHVQAALYQEKCSRLKFHGRLGEHQRRSRHGGETYILLPGIEHFSRDPSSSGIFWHIQLSLVWVQTFF